MKNYQSIIEKLKKVRALMESTSGPEHQAAKSMFDKLVSQYNIDLEELEKENIETYYIAYGSAREKELLHQIAAAKFGLDAYLVFRGKKRLRGYSFECTYAQYVELSCMYGFYKSLLKDDLEVLYLAFLDKHDLFRIVPEDQHIISNEEIEKRERAKSMARGMNDSMYRKQLR